MTTAETYSASENSALLRTDFASFAQHCFHELNPRTLFAASWYHDIIAVKLESVRTGRSAAPPEVAPGLGLLSGLVPRPRPERPAALRHPRVSKAPVRRERSPGARTSPTNCRAIAGRSLPATGIGSSVPPAFRPSAKRC